MIVLRIIIFFRMMQQDKIFVMKTQQLSNISQYYNRMCHSYIMNVLITIVIERNSKFNEYEKPNFV